MRAFGGRLFAGMWCGEAFLKPAQVKHGLCHTCGNDRKLVWEGALVFLKCETLDQPSESGPDRSVLGAATLASYLESNILRSQNPLLCVVNSPQLFSVSTEGGTGGNKTDQTTQTGLSLDIGENILLVRIIEQQGRAV